MWCAYSLFKRSVLVFCMSVTMHSFSAEVGSRGYHVYCETSWRNIHLHQHIVVLKEINNISIDIDPYCCRITIKIVARIGPVTVGHVPRELPIFIFYFIQEEGWNSCKHHTKNVTHSRTSVRRTDLNALYP